MIVGVIGKWLEGTLVASIFIDSRCTLQFEGNIFFKSRLSKKHNVDPNSLLVQYSNGKFVFFSHSIFLLVNCQIISNLPPSS